MARITTAFFLSILLAPTVVAQDQIVYRTYGGTNARAGTAVAGAGDIDHDGHDDVVYGLPESDSGGTDSGRIEVRSGRTGALIHSFAGQAGDHLGWSVAGGFDADGDGTDDVAGGWNEFDSSLTGGVAIWSGATGALLCQRTGSGGLGLAVDGIGDIDGDGDDEIVVGYPSFTVLFGQVDAGLVQVLRYDPASTTAQVVMGTSGSTMDGALGTSVTGAGDINGDGVPDFAAGEPGYKFSNGQFVINPGRVRVYSGLAAAQGQVSVVRNFVTSESFGRIGRRLDGGRDVNGDGTPDIITGADTNFCEVYSGNGGAPLHTFQTGEPSLARSVALVGDVNGDGRSEFAIGLPLLGNGEARLLDGATGTILHRMFGRSGSLQGVAMASAGDVDGDGRGDLVVGASTENQTSGTFSVIDAGAVRVYSFSDAFEHFVGGTFGQRAAPLADVDGDQRTDYVICSPRDAPVLSTPGRIWVYSGADDSLIYTVVGQQNADRFGASATSIDDLDGDGTPDLLVGAPDEDWPGAVDGGAVYVLSGLFGTPIAIDGGGAFLQAGARLGSSVAALDDVTGDGVPDFAVGAPLAKISPTAPVTGIVLIYSGATRTAITALSGVAAGDDFGSTLARLEDVNGDDIAELAVGVPGDSGDSGRVVVFDGATLTTTATTIHAVSGTSTSRFGEALADAGDVDGDGGNDLIVGAPGYDTFLAPDRGRIQVLCGLTGTVLFSTTGEASNDRFGSSVDGCGDIDGDGLGDVVAGAPLHDANLVNTGCGYVISGTGIILRRYPGGYLDGAGAAVAGLGDRNDDGFLDVLIAHDSGSLNSDFVFIYSPGRLAGIEAYGRGTPGCKGVVRLVASSPPRIGNASFAVVTDNAPPLTTGTTIIGDATLRLDTGVDPFALGVLFHIDLLSPPPVLFTTNSTDAAGYSSIAAPLPDIPAIVGFSLLLQGIWYEGPCQPGFGYSTTNGLEITILP